MKNRGFLLFFLLIFSPSPSFSSGWGIRDQFAFGDGNLAMNSLDVVYSSKTSKSWGAGYVFYSDKSSPQTVSSAHLSFARYYPQGFWGLKPVWYPEIKERSAAGIAFYSSYIFDPAEEEQTEASANLSWFRQRALVTDTSGTRPKIFSQGSGEGELRQDLGRGWSAGLTGSFFVYDFLPQRFLAVDAIVNQSEAAFFSNWNVVRELPRWSIGLGLRRTLKPLADGELVLGWSRVEFRRLADFAHSYLLELRWNAGKGWKFHLGYNAWRESSRDFKNYYSAGLGYTWE